MAERERKSESKLEPKTGTETESIKTQLWLREGEVGAWGKQLPDTKSKATTQGILTDTHTHTYEGKILS